MCCLFYVGFDIRITVILYRRNEECGKGDEEDLSWCQQVGRN